MIKVNCRSCGKHLEAPYESAGRKGRCPGCGEVFAIPDILFSPGEESGSPAGQNHSVKQAPPGGGQPASGISNAEKFSVKEAVGFGWNVMKGSLGFFIGLLIIAGLSFVIPEVLADALESAGLSGLHLVVRLLDFALATVVSLGLYYKIPLDFCDGVGSKIADLFLHYRFFFRYIFASFLYFFLLAGGLVFLILPGIYLAIRFSFYAYFIVDRNAGIAESLKNSWRITQGSVWKLFVFSLAIGGLNVLGALALGIGLFATIPTSILAGAYIYRKLLASAEISGALACSS